MPIYEYECKDCGSRFKALRPMRDSDAVIHCDKCSSQKTSRVLSTCFSHSETYSTGANSSGCSGCSGGSCSSCSH